MFDPETYTAALIEKSLKNKEESVKVYKYHD